MRKLSDLLNVDGCYPMHAYHPRLEVEWSIMTSPVHRPGLPAPSREDKTVRLAIKGAVLTV